MPHNLEIKIEVNNHLKFINKLEDIGAIDFGFLIQQDVYFKVKNSLLKLRIENGKESLIYYNREEKKNKKRWSEYYVLHLKDNSGKNFFSKLFNIETIVEKKRRLFIYENTRIHIDKVKNLGNFIELETIVEKSKSDAVKRFNYIKNYLEIDKFVSIRKSYRDLMLNK